MCEKCEAISFRPGPGSQTIVTFDGRDFVGKKNFSRWLGLAGCTSPLRYRIENKICLLLSKSEASVLASKKKKGTPKNRGATEDELVAELTQHFNGWLRSVGKVYRAAKCA